jgi:hypothetical protein
MSFYYPQAVMTLRVRWEDFDDETNRVLSGVKELQVLARRISVDINDYTQADTFSAEIDYKNFPFDPRTIRALGVTIHIEDRKQFFRSDNALNLIVPSKENTIFQGFADKESLSFDDSTRIVNFEGRDFTGLLLDSSYSGKAIDLAKPLDEILQILLNELPSTSEGKIVLDNRSGLTLPTLGSFAPDFNALANQRSGKKNEKYWDVIQDLVGRAGLIAYIELDKLVITRPRALYGDSQPIQFIYGKNIENLEFTRQLGRQKGINVVARSVSVETKETLEVRIPEEASVEWSNSIGVARERQKIDKIDAQGQKQTEDAPFISFVVPNIKNTEQLRVIGQGIWEELGRQQIEGTLSTREMGTRQQSTATDEILEFDLTKIRTGTPVKIEIDQGDMEGFSRQKTVEQRKRFLLTRSYPPDIANALAVAGGKFQTRFYTKSVQFSLDVDSGFKMDLSFINFIELGNKGLSNG